MAKDQDYDPGKDSDEADFVPAAVTASLRRGRASGGGGTSKSSSKRSAHSGPVPKLKVKVSANQEAHEPMYTVRKHDRDLDSDPDEDLIVEEQFILRIPPGELLKKMREQVASRELGKKKGVDEPWFKFRDSRRAVFGWGKVNQPEKSQMYHAKLVDLPAIIESHKTPDAGKHMYKCADICQMLLVEEAIAPGQDPTFFDQEFKIDEYMYPHGITPPLRHVRKRRFRRRANKRTIEMVERKVEELLKKDNAAEKVTYELVDQAEVEEATPSVARSPSRTPSLPPETPKDGDESMGAPTPAADDKEDEESSQDEIDDDLAAELERGIGQAEDDSSDSGGDGDGSDSDMGGLFGSGGSDAEAPEDDDDVDENDPQQVEYRRRARLLGEEVKDLEGVVARKTTEVANATNPIIKRRFEDTLKKLTQELELKKGQLAVALAGPKKQEPEGDEEQQQNEGSPAA